MEKIINLVKKALDNKVVRYIISGGSIYVINISLFVILMYLGMDYKLANLIAITVSKLSGYISQRYFVFKQTGGSETTTLIKYVIARASTGVIEYIGLIILVDLFLINPVISKNMMFIIVIILNYFFSHWFVFNAKSDNVNA